MQVSSKTEICLPCPGQSQFPDPRKAPVFAESAVCDVMYVLCTCLRPVITPRIQGTSPLTHCSPLHLIIHWFGWVYWTCGRMCRGDVQMVGSIHGSRGWIHQGPNVVINEWMDGSLQTMQSPFPLHDRKGKQDSTRNDIRKHENRIEGPSSSMQGDIPHILYLGAGNRDFSWSIGGAIPLILDLDYFFRILPGIIPTRLLTHGTFVSSLVVCEWACCVLLPNNTPSHRYMPGNGLLLYFWYGFLLSSWTLLYISCVMRDLPPKKFPKCLVRCNKHQRRFVFLKQNTPELFWMQQTIQRY